MMRERERGEYEMQGHFLKRENNMTIVGRQQMSTNP